MKIVGGSSAIERHRRRIVDGDHVGRDPHLREQLAHDLLGDLLLGFVDPVDVARAFGHRRREAVRGGGATG